MQVAILNGITMGGGAGVSIPGTFRIATDKTVCNKDTCTHYFSLLQMFVGLVIGPYFIVPCSLFHEDSHKLFCKILPLLIVLHSSIYNFI